MRPFSLYLHIPFCIQKCPYCDFNTYALATFPEREYTAALCAEIDRRASESDWLGRPIQTIYFGGGTPSVFSSQSIKRIIAVISQRFHVLDNVEVSLEANPGNISYDLLAGYVDAGVNRISLGAQSFNQDTLKSLGRTHTPDQILTAVEISRSVRLNNINIDLMFGAPFQTIDNLRSDISEALKLQVPHISSYGLTIEKGTPFYSSFKKGILKIPDEDIVAKMMIEIKSLLEAASLMRYEISNFAKMGYAARHNLAYWNGDDYLGIGAGAHSFIRIGDGGKRWSNYALPARYIKSATNQGFADAWSETLKVKDIAFEFFFLGLRKMSGVSLSEFESRFNISINKAYRGVFDALVGEDLLLVEGDRLRLTDKGVLLADSVIENFSDPEL